MRGQWITSPNSEVSVVFVHGVLSDGDSCWTNPNGCYWPQLLSSESSLAPLGIYVFTYSTGFFSGSYSLSDVVDALKEHMRLDRVSESKRLVFVCHSMGGIVVRKFIVERSAELIEEQKEIGLFLVASPSLGSSYADWLSPVARSLGHSQADALRFVRNNIWLSGLDKEFKNLKESGRLKIAGKELVEDKFVALRSFIRRQIVEPFTGAVYFGESFKVANSDHFSISKPVDETAIQHRLLCEFIRRIKDDNPYGHPYTYVDSRISSQTQSNQSFEPLSKPGSALVASSIGSPPTIPNKGMAAVPTTAVRLRRLTHNKKLVLVCGVVLGILAWLLFSPRVPAVTSRDPILVGDFHNTTGDAQFDVALRQGLIVQLEQSPFLSLVPEHSIQQALKSMGAPNYTTITPENVLEVCQRTNSIVAISGSIGLLGSHYLLSLNATRCSSDTVLANVDFEATDKQHVLSSLGKAASKLRRTLGESHLTVDRFETPIEQATTPSLEALKSYGIGRQRMVGDSDSSASIPFFQRAIELDKNFAVAYSSLGTSYFNLGEKDRSFDNTQQAFRLRTNVSEREKFYIESHYYHLATGDLYKAQQVYEVWSSTYPRDPVPPTNLGAVHAALGHYEQSLKFYNAGLDLNPGSGLNYGSMFDCYVAMDRFEEAEGMLEQMRNHGIESTDLHDHLYQLAFLKSDARGMSEQLQWAAQNPSEGDVLYHLEAETAAYRGDLSKARDFTLRAVLAVVDQPDKKEVAAGYHAAAALREALYGNQLQAKGHAETAALPENGRDALYGAALALAFLSHDKMAQNRAEELVDSLASRFSDDTLVKNHYVPTVRAELLLNKGDIDDAIQELEVATSYELGTPGVTSFSPNLYAVYVRGEAYLAAGRTADALAEFRKIPSHRGLALNEPIAALAHLEIARCEARAGHAEAGRANYSVFLNMWKNADPRIPIFIIAKKEYSKLN